MDKVMHAAARQQCHHREAHLDISHAQPLASEPWPCGKMVVNEPRMGGQLRIEPRFLYPLAQQRTQRANAKGHRGLPRLANTSFINSSGISEPSA